MYVLLRPRPFLALQGIRVIRLLRLMKLTRMARLSRIATVFERWEMEMAVPYAKVGAENVVGSGRWSCDVCAAHESHGGVTTTGRRVTPFAWDDGDDQ
jgi:hypothetical protein